MNQSHYAAALKRHTAAIRTAHLAAADTVAQSARVSDVLEYLRAGDTMGLVRHLQPAHIGETLRSVFVAGGNDEAAHLPAWAAAGQRDARRTTFDPAQSDAAEWLMRATARVRGESEARHRGVVSAVSETLTRAGENNRLVASSLVGTRNARTGKRQGGAIMQSIDAAPIAHEFYNAGRRHLHQQAIQQGVDAQRALRTYQRATVRDAATPPQDSVDLRIASALIEHSIQLLRVEAGINNDVQALLTQMEKELTAKLAAGSLTTFAQERLAGMLDEAKSLIASHYDEAQEKVDGEDLADMETNFTARMLAREVGVKLASGIVPETVLRTLVGNLLIQGAPSAEWWAQQAADTTFRFANAVRQGIAQNETVAQMVTRVQDDVMPVSKRNAQSLVISSVQTVTNSARLETYKQNDDVIEGVRQISTLDGQTSTICVAYSGGEWDLDGKPIKPTKLPFVNAGGSADGCPRHWRCRSVLAPIVTGVLGSFQPSQRAAKGGPVSAKLSFSEWLETKPLAFQNDLLGEGRAELWRSGKMSLSDLLDQSGRPLTTAELRAKYD